EIAKIFSGLLPIGSQGCTYLHAVVVNGSYKGRIVYLDVDLQKPKFAYEKNFLDWYERWLDEIISGVLISESPTWFGYSRGGDDKQLLDIYYASENPETKIEALSGLLKLNQVCEASCLKLLELCSDGNPEVRHRAVGLLTKFNYPMAVESLRKHINGDDRDCIAACRSIASYAKKMSGKWIDCLKQRLPRLNDEEAFHSLTCLLLESKIDCSDDLKPFCFHKNEEIRVRVFYVFGELKKKSSLVELFLLGLRDPSSRVVHATIQALSGVRDKRLLKAYGNILSRFETDEHYILTNLKLRLNEMGFPTSEVFNKSSEYGKLERENVFRALNKKNKTGGLFKRLFK
ncbi:MAG: HEAT repeat domain-containing protein, partial [bacterium]|nr:HEAT repeat domain-containing protein [bacterium]